MEKLFSYGTLQLPEVQQNLFGRLLSGWVDQLPGYTIKDLKINDRAVIQKSGTDIHPILVLSEKSENVVSGMIFEITMDELNRADEYEVDDYERVLEKMVSGVEAWVYRSPVPFT